MVRWQYAILSNPYGGMDSVEFSHLQDAAIVQEASAYLGEGLHAENSNPGLLHLNLPSTTPVVVAGFLGQREWEMVSHSTMTGTHEYWTFKKLLPG